MPDATPPAESTQPRSLRREIGRRAVITAAVFALYFLSIGPLYWAWYDAKFNSGSPYLAVCYEPLFRLSEAWPWFGRVVDTYVMWWIA